MSLAAVVRKLSELSEMKCNYSLIIRNCLLVVCIFVVGVCVCVCVCVCIFFIVCLVYVL